MTNTQGEKIKPNVFIDHTLLKKSLESTAPARDRFVTLFVSVGKNRKVFPNDLRGLFTSRLELASGEIKNIKILDNYSFIDIPESHASRAIDLLDATDYRGRKITVNYSRKKKETS